MLDLDKELESLNELALSSEDLFNRAGKDKLLEISVDDISSKEQARKVFEDIDSLAQSLKEVGQLTPINVSEDPEHEGKYIIEQGERRWRAAKAAGLETIKCVVVEAPEAEDREIRQLTENIQRDSMRPHEISAVFAKLIAKGMNNAEIGRLFGWSRQRVKVFTDMIGMPEVLLKASKTGEISDSISFQILCRYAKIAGLDALTDALEAHRDTEGKISISRSEAQNLIRAFNEEKDRAEKIMSGVEDAPGNLPQSLKRSLASQSEFDETDGAEAASNNRKDSTVAESARLELPTDCIQTRTVLRVKVSSENESVREGILLSNALCKDKPWCVVVKFDDGKTELVNAGDVKLTAAVLP